MSLAASVNQPSLLPLNTAFNRNVFVGVTGLTMTATIGKGAAAFGALAGAITELTLGWYKLAYAAGDTDTEGDLRVNMTDGGSNIVNFKDQVSANVKLGDKMDHGGTPGSSTATIAAAQINVKNTTADPAFVIDNTTGPTLVIANESSNQASIAILSTQSSVAAVSITQQGTGDAFDILAGSGSGLYIQGTNSAIYLYEPSGSNPVIAVDASSTTGNAITLTPGTGGKALGGTGGIDVGTISNCDLASIAGQSSFGGVTLLKQMSGMFARMAGRKTGLTGGAATGVQVKLADGTLVFTCDVDANGNTSNIVFA